MSESLLSVRALTKSYGEIRAVDGVDLDVETGQILCLVGPNGSGKTTLIECVEGLRSPDQGSITLFGNFAGSRRQRARKLGVQLQEEGLPSRIRVGEAIRLFAAIYGVTKNPEELIAELGLEDLVRRPFDALSGGQKRRTALALAFIHEPQLAVLDEPTSGLDPDGQSTISAIIRDRAARGTGILTTTHDMQIAADLADQVAVIRDGQIVANDAPDRLQATLPHPWCLVGPAMDSTIIGSRELDVVRDGASSRIFGDRAALEELLEELPAGQRVRQTLRRTDLSDLAFRSEIGGAR